MFTKRTVFGAVVIVCLVVSVLVGYGYAQAVRPPIVPGHVFSGDEIGFRVEGMHPGERSRATLLIKIDGEWHEFQPTIDVTPLAK